MNSQVNRKKSQEKLDLITKEELSNERAKMEKLIADKVLNGGSLTSEEILIMSEAFDSLINVFMRNN
ncbi:MAG TPA: Spo0E family sporulation regulatory protein-aspartic acid phosphatase [Clostridia bacterium]